ncbi:hypothetical protein HNQ82_002149 [Anoxybacillus tengchongensis]|uniref:Uncharacterized protein n=1 Tax=Anoxybacillus tengchongensis TaxID=576944 RepID=A0A7W9YTE2_9BACL|nr:hypothetical protein [Anoxybacillus tengchongensis]MBB6177316.1 hypothetical protein [Anoxybacillus tengchongensis]
MLIIRGTLLYLLHFLMYLVVNVIVMAIIFLVVKFIVTFVFSDNTFIEGIAFILMIFIGGLLFLSSCILAYEDFKENFISVVWNHAYEEFQGFDEMLKLTLKNMWKSDRIVHSDSEGV